MSKVKGYIRRKSMLYVTGVEYGNYTMNHVLGCAHGCKYPCYAFLMKKRFGKVSSYEEWLEPYLVENTLELLDVEIPKLKDKIISVQLCFSTDPFMYGYDEVGAMSMAAIRKLNEHGIKCTVLTKGLLPIELAEFSSENEYGITLISLTETFQNRWNLMLRRIKNGCPLFVPFMTEAAEHGSALSLIRHPTSFARTWTIYWKRFLS